MADKADQLSGVLLQHICVLEGVNEFIVGF